MPTRNSLWPDLPKDAEEPDVEQLEEWDREGGCETTDGCWVEPDGVCDHGYPSWMVYMGLI